MSLSYILKYTVCQFQIIVKWLGSDAKEKLLGIGLRPDITDALLQATSCVDQEVVESALEYFDGDEEVSHDVEGALQSSVNPALLNMTILWTDLLALHHVPLIDAIKSMRLKEMITEKQSQMILTTLQSSPLIPSTIWVRRMCHGRGDLSYLAHFLPAQVMWDTVVKYASEPDLDDIKEDEAFASDASGYTSKLLAECLEETIDEHRAVIDDLTRMWRQLYVCEELVYSAMARVVCCDLWKLFDQHQQQRNFESMVETESKEAERVSLKALDIFCVYFASIYLSHYFNL